MKLLWEETDRLQAIAKKNFFILDMDGTLYIDQVAIPGAVQFVEWLQAEKKEFVFLTNNSSKSQDAYLKKIRGMGFRIRAHQLFTSNLATGYYLKEHFSSKNVCFLGTADAAEELKINGIQVNLPFDRNMDIQFEVCVLAYDTSLTYEKLKNFCLILRRNVFYISTHIDINCPSKEGPIPDNGSMIQLIYASTGRKPDILLGKPRAEMIEFLLEYFHQSKEDTVIIGDRAYTDIRMGYDNGVDTLLVLSGETKQEEIALTQYPPDWVAHSLLEVINGIQQYKGVV